MSAQPPTWAYEPYLSAFRGAAATVSTHSNWDRQLVCRVGYHMDCAVLKVQKAEWTNDNLSAMGNQTGVFFSIWITQKRSAAGRAEYNIHAMQLRKVNGFRLT